MVESTREDARSTAASRRVFGADAPLGSPGLGAEASLLSPVEDLPAWGRPRWFCGARLEVFGVLLFRARGNECE